MAKAFEESFDLDSDEELFGEVFFYFLKQSLMIELKIKFILHR